MARMVTGTITIAVSPIGDKYDVRMWVGNESVRVKKPSLTREEALVWAGMFKRTLRETVSAEIIIVESPIPDMPSGPQPDLYHVKP